MKKIIFYSILAASICAISFITGCSTTTENSTRVSGKDSSYPRGVSWYPAKTAFNGTVGTGIGAMHRQYVADNVTLDIVIFNDHNEITGAELIIDGEKVTLLPAYPQTRYVTTDGDATDQSIKPYYTDLQTLQKIIDSKQTSLRVHTPAGMIENAVIDGDTNSRAYQRVVLFMDIVSGKDVQQWTSTDPTADLLAAYIQRRRSGTPTVDSSTDWFGSMEKHVLQSGQPE